MAIERPDASAARWADYGAVGHAGCTDRQSRPLGLVASPVIEDAAAGLLLVADGSDDLPLVRELKLD